MPDRLGRLGEGTYDAIVKRRRTPLKKGGTVGTLKVRFGSWGRKLNGVSSAGLTVPTTGKDGRECCKVLDLIRPLRDELHLFRDGELVWLGPILDVKGDPDQDTGVLTARDRAQWVYWRVFRHTMQPVNVELAEIFEGYVRYLLAGELPPWGSVQAGDPPLSNYADDPGLEISTSPTGITGTRTVYHGDLKVGGTELEELSRTGVDWTVANARMWAGGLSIRTDTGKPMYTPAILTDEHFRTRPTVRRTGESMATEALIRGNNVRGAVGGPDPDDGMLVQRVLDEYSIEDQASGDAAAQTYWDSSHLEQIYLEGNNALDPKAPIDVQELIPGLLQRVAVSGGGCVTYASRLRLEGIDVNFNAESGEEITVTMQPEGTSGDAVGPG